MITPVGKQSVLYLEIIIQKRFLMGWKIFDIRMIFIYFLKKFTIRQYALVKSRLFFLIFRFYIACFTLYNIEEYNKIHLEH